MTGLSGRSAKKPDWAEYEALAHQIVGELAPFAEVSHNVRMYGKESEARRQIDVCARWNDGQNENVMIVQVKDYRRRADVNTIGEFRSVVQDVGAQKGILICSGGFSRKAITYARNLGLLLWSLADAKSTKWASELTIPVVRVKLTPSVAFTGAFRAVRDGVGMEVREADGLPFDVIGTFKSAWISGQMSVEPDIEHAFDLGRPLFVHLLDADNGSPGVPLEMDIRYTVRRQCLLGYLSPDDYRGIRDHLAGERFVPSYLELTIPALSDGAWSPISDPGRLAIRTRESFLVLQEVEVGEWGMGRLTMTEVDESGSRPATMPPPG